MTLTTRQHNTEIEWTHPPGFLGETWNPTSGCTKVSPACANCYAELLSRRFNLSPPFLPGQYRIDLHYDRLELPLRWASIPRCIFVDSMSDLFHEDIPFDFIDKVMAVVYLCQQHIFQVLTKRPDIMRQYFESNPLPRIKGAAYEFQRVNVQAGQKPWSERIKERLAEPDVWPFENLWLGVSTENQEWLNKRLPILLQIPAVVHFISAEPLLGPVQCEAIPYPTNLPVDATGNVSAEMGELNAYTGKWEYDLWKGSTGTLDWVIMGGESGSKVRLTHVQWFRNLRDACAQYDTPVFMKQWGSWGIMDSDVASRLKSIAKTDGIQYSKVQTGFKFHVRLANNRKALCGFEADLKPQEIQSSRRARRWWKSNIESKPTEAELCWACLRILSPVVRYARLDPRDRSRQPKDLIKDTDVPMMRKGKTLAGNELDGQHYKQFPDLTHFELAHLVAKAPEMPPEFLYSVPKQGKRFHIRPSNNTDNVICGWLPKSPKPSSRNGSESSGYWRETVSEGDLNGRYVCPKCLVQKEGKRWLSRYSTLTETATTGVQQSVLV